MRTLKRMSWVLAPALLLSACNQPPMGPTVQVLPQQGKPFEVFQGEDAMCRQYASDQVRGGAEAANNQAVGTAVVGTLLGAGVGAALGGGRGAAAGAGIGALGGTAVAGGNSERQQYSLQQRYNMSYSQCMYAKGNQVPGYYAPPPPAYPPPPPPGYYR